MQPIKQLTAFNETKSFSEWAKDPRCQVTDRTIRKRVGEGMLTERAISLPAQHNGGRPKGSKDKCKRKSKT